MIWFYASLALAVAVQAADILTTNAFLARGGKEKMPLNLWATRTLGAWWPLPKLAIAAASVGICWYIAASYSPVAGAILLAVPVLFTGAVGVYGNLQWLRENG
jgi:hypothetical protein